MSKQQHKEEEDREKEQERIAKAVEKEEKANEKEPSKQQLTHPPKQKLGEPQTINKGSSIEQTKTEDPKAAFIEEDLSNDKKRAEKIEEIKYKLEWNRTHDKADQKEVTLAEENLVYGHVQE